jgi:hypothetical protein
MINNQEIKKLNRKLTPVGELFFRIEVLLYNIRTFIGRHEKTFEIIFLFIYVLLQLWLAYSFPKSVVTIIVIIFLFFLSIERIFVRISSDYKIKKLDNKEKRTKLIQNKWRLMYHGRIKELEGQIEILTKNKINKKLNNRG